MALEIKMQDFPNHTTVEPTPDPVRRVTFPMPPTRVIINPSARRASERYLNPATGITARSIGGVARFVAERARDAFVDPNRPTDEIRFFYLPHVAGDDHEAVERAVQSVGEQLAMQPAEPASKPNAPSPQFSRARRRTRLAQR